jgi:Protein of unknown function (DUF1559)
MVPFNDRAGVTTGPLAHRPGREAADVPVAAALSAAAARTSHRAVVAFVPGLLSFVSGTLAVAWRSDACALAVIGFALPALALSVLAWKRIITQPASLRGKPFAGWGIGLSLCGLALGFLGLPAVSVWDEATPRAVAEGRFRQIARAVQLYADDHGGRLPPPAVHDKKGRPLYSWRVLLLPYLGHQRLYRAFQRDEPWDSPNNLALLSAMPEVYAPPPGVETETEPYTTFCQVLVGPGTAFEGDQGVPIPGAFTNGTSNTLLLVEAGRAVPWTKPVDLPYAEDRPVPPLGGVFTGPVRFRLSSAGRTRGFHAATADGEVRFIRADVNEATLRRAIARYEMDVLGSNW